MNSRSDDSPGKNVRPGTFPGRNQEGERNTERSAGWTRPGDEALLRSLRRDGPESCPLLAARIGMHLKYARRRCEELEARGLVRSRDERFYELTEQGRVHLDGINGDADANADSGSD